jgi:outer membrane protein assembly factor BamB
VVNEIQNFLAATESPWEDNNQTIRIFYYVGHSGIKVPAPPGSQMGFYLALGDRLSHPPNASDPLNPSSYQELWDFQLNKTLNYGDLAKNNCTLIIFDSCHSQGAILALTRLGRVILTACGAQELAWGWKGGVPPPPARDRWSWFTGQDLANSQFSNGTAFGLPLGLIGATQVAADNDKDGWRSAKELFLQANFTTYQYSKAYPGRTQIPRKNYGVFNGYIPVLLYNASCGFTYNGNPSSLGDFEVQNPWDGFHHDSSRGGITGASGPSSSDVLWSKSGYDTNASVVVSELEAIVAAKSGVVYGLDLRTGNEMWRFTTESQILATPFVANGMVYVATFGGGGGGGGAGGILYAIDEATARIRWQYQAPTGTGFFASPAVADGRVFAATTSETSTSYGIYVLNQTTGQMLWSRLLDTPIKSSPAIRNGRVYVATTTQGSTPARLHAITEFTGIKVWNYSFGLSNLISTLAVGAGKVIIGCMGGGGGGGAGAGLYAFQESSGTLLWDFPTSYPVSSSPAIDETNDVVVFGIEAASIYALTLTGSQRWIYPSYGPMKMSSPAISSNGLVYVGMANNWLLCLNEMSGLSVWSYLTDGPIFSSPAIVDNHVLIGTTGSSVYCFGPPFPEHDVSAKRVFPQQTVVTQGETVTIEYTVKNEGNVDEGVTVTIGYRNVSEPSYADLNELYVDDFMLAAGTQTTRYYLWDTTDMPSGTYNTTLTAHMIPGEADIADNILVNGSVTIIMPGVHDVTIASVTPAKTVVCQTMTMKISVEVSNLGAFPETFNVMVAAVPNVGVPRIVGLQQVSLAPAETKIMIFVWQTTGSPIDTYTIEAYADTVPGEEVTANNVRSDGQVKVSILGDINADNIVNIKDATQIGLNWLQLVPPANPNADINDDGIINIKDATIIGVHWLETYP